MKNTIRRSNVSVAICACFVLLNPLSVAVAQYHIDTWTTGNGLPHNSVRGILQTRDGYLWLATADGLVRFDGVKFTTFKREN